MKIRIINPCEEPEWNLQIGKLQGATIFHTSNWANVLKDTYKYNPLYITAYGDGQIAGCIPLMEIKSFLTGRRGVSLPFTDECEILGEDNEIKYKLLETALSHIKKQKWKTIEFRSKNPVSNDIKPTIKFASHRLHLDKTEEELFKSFKSNNRRNIKKAIKQGVTTQILNDLDSIKTFYKLNLMTRKKHGVPPQPYRFYKNIFKYIISQDYGFTTIGLKAGVPVAGAIYLFFQDNAIYKFGASNMKYQNLRANNLVMWDTIKHFVNSGFKTFHFGRTEFENTGLLRFKEGWTPEIEELEYFKYDSNQQPFLKENKIKSSYFFFRAMPTFMLKISGKILYRHVG